MYLFVRCFVTFFSSKRWIYSNADFFCCHSVDWLIFKSLKYTDRYTRTHNLNWSRPHNIFAMNTCVQIQPHWHKDQTAERKKICSNILQLHTFWFFFFTSDSHHHNGHNYGNCQEITASHYAKNCLNCFVFLSFVYSKSQQNVLSSLSHSWAQLKLNSRTLKIA